MGRRQALLATLLLAGSAAGWPRLLRADTSLPRLTSLPGNPEVVVVGAGMAGIAAARELTSRGIAVAVLEGRTRVGGRAFTESDRLGLPFDHGCSWIHDADDNPVLQLARAAGFETAVDEQRLAVFLRGNEASDEEYDRYSELLTRIEAGIARLADDRGDVAVAQALPKGSGDLVRLAAAMFGPLDHGLPNELLSTRNLDDSGPDLADRLVRDGLGRLVASLADGLPIALSRTVTRIGWGGNGVQVETDAGTLQASTCIVTVPIGVLNAGAIRFDPPLPARKQEALAGLQMGLLNKVGLTFKSNPFERAPAFLNLHGISGQGTPFFALVRPFARDHAIMLYGAEDAALIEGMPEADAVALAVGALADIYGEGVRAAFDRGVVTRWLSDPFSFGSYSAAMVGKAALRRRIGEPVDDRLFFAGEAQDSRWGGTLPGAYLSGRRAAELVLRELR